MREPRRIGSTPMGMVQVGSLTFSILQLTPTSYGVVRVLDDRFLGTFQNHPCLDVFPEHSIDTEVLRSIARMAMRQGRTAWSGDP